MIWFRLEHDVSNNPAVCEASAYKNHYRAQLDSLYNRPGEKSKSLNQVEERRTHTRLPR